MAIRLLIVEADEYFCQNLREPLHRKGFVVYGTNGAAEVEAILEEEDIDVVLLGLQGYGHKGVVLLERIKEKQPQAEVILMVPTGQLALSIEGMKRGAFDDILVPVDLATLLERIEDAYRQKQKKVKPKKSLKERLEAWMVAASFAEAGAPEAAQNVLGKGKKGSGRRKRKI
jgi:DNA-binding NtrC family response regulator